MRQGQARRANLEQHDQVLTQLKALDGEARRANNTAAPRPALPQLRKQPPRATNREGLASASSRATVSIPSLADATASVGKERTRSN
jgi:hypothetical protein